MDCTHHAVSCRADLVTPMPGHTGKTQWRLQGYKNRQDLALWLSDERLGTFLAGPPERPPNAADVYRLRVLDEEDEHSIKQQERQQQQLVEQVRRSSCYVWQTCIAGVCWMKRMSTPSSSRSTSSSSSWNRRGILCMTRNLYLVVP